MPDLAPLPEFRFCGLTLDAPEVARRPSHRVSRRPSHPKAAPASALIRIGGALRAACAAWKRRRAIAASYRALRALDAATLRDLGWSDAELLSVACEATAAAPLTRRRVVDAPASAAPDASLI